MNRGGFSWKTFLGITTLKRNFSKKIGIPMTITGIERKIGGIILKTLGLKK